MPKLTRQELYICKQDIQRLLDDKELNDEEMTEEIQEHYDLSTNTIGGLIDRYRLIRKKSKVFY